MLTVFVISPPPASAGDSLVALTYLPYFTCDGFGEYMHFFQVRPHLS